MCVFVIMFMCMYLCVFVCVSIYSNQLISYSYGYDCSMIYTYLYVV